MEEKRGSFPEILHFNTNREFLNEFADMFNNNLDIVSFDNINSISKKGNNGLFDVLILSYNSLKDCKIRCLEEIKTLYPSSSVILYGKDITPNVVRDFFVAGVDEFLIFDHDSSLCKEKVLRSINRLINEKNNIVCNHQEVFAKISRLIPIGDSINNIDNFYSFFKSVMEISSDLVISCNLEGKLNMINTAFGEIFGIDRDNPGSVKLTEFIHPDDREYFREFVIDKIKKETSTKDFEIRMCTKQGDIRFVEFKCSVIKHDRGETAGLIGVGRDVTEARKIEKALRESEEKLREQNKYNILRAKIWELAADKTLSDHQLFCDLLEIIGTEFGVDRACFNIFNDNIAECVFEWCHKGIKPSLGTKMPVNLVKYLIAHDFTVLTVDTVMQKVPDFVRPIAKVLIDNLIEELKLEKVIVIPCHINGIIEGTITLDLCTGHGGNFQWTDEKIRIMMDCVKIITHSISNKRMESRFLETEAKYSALVEQATDGVVIIRQGVFEFVNKALLKMTGYLPSDLMGKLFLDFLDPEYKNILRDKIKNFQDSPEIPLPSQVKIVKKDGKNLDMEISCSYIKYGGKSAIMGIMRDITQRKEMERELIGKNRELNDFAYMISHDLKNPLIIINGYLNVIKDKPEMFNVYYEKVLDSSSRLISYISNLLELSRSGKIIADETNIILDVLYKEVYKIIKPEDIEAELIIRNPGLNFKGDYNRIKQVIINLFQNAIRYRDKNKKKLIIEASGIKEKDSILISIKDNGSGITKENLDKMFNAGFTIDKNIGTGFGLAISRKIIGAHGGKIWAESEGEGRGANIFIEIPQKFKNITEASK